MNPDAFLPTFFGVWLTAAAYVASVGRLMLRIRHLKAHGKALEVPTVWGGDADALGGIAWLVTGRYAGLDDPVAARWGRIAQVLLFVAGPLILGMFAWVAFDPPTDLMRTR